MQIDVHCAILFMQVVIQQHACCYTTDNSLHCQQQSTNLAKCQASVILQDGIPFILTGTVLVGFVVDKVHWYRFTSKYFSFHTNIILPVLHTHSVTKHQH